MLLHCSSHGPRESQIWLTETLFSCQIPFSVWLIIRKRREMIRKRRETDSASRDLKFLESFHVCKTASTRIRPIFFTAKFFFQPIFFNFLLSLLFLPIHPLEFFGFLKTNFEIRMRQKLLNAKWAFSHTLHKIISVSIGFSNN